MDEVTRLFWILRIVFHPCGSASPGGINLALVASFVSDNPSPAASP